MTDHEGMTMLEIVARAHWEARRKGFSIPRMGIHEVMEWNHLTPEFRASEIVATKAALEALKSPTEEMLRAFYEATCPPGETPIGGFSRWAPWEQARQFRAPEIAKGLAAMMEAASHE